MTIAACVAAPSAAIMAAMPPSPAVATIAQTIQLSLSPVFLLTGIGAVLNLLVGRLSRVIDRARALEERYAAADRGRQADARAELRLLARRMTVINAGLFLCVTSAIAVCTVVALLFVAQLVKLHIGRIVAWIFIAAMLLLVAGLAAFVGEVRLSLRATRIAPELLER